MKNKRKRWKNGVILIPVLCVLLLTGCGLFQEEKIKLRDLDFTVLSDEKIPEELKTVIAEKGTEPFHLTYSDDQNLYISIGYNSVYVMGMGSKEVTLPGWLLLLFGRC